MIPYIRQLLLFGRLGIEACADALGIWCASHHWPRLVWWLFMAALTPFWLAIAGASMLAITADDIYAALMDGAKTDHVGHAMTRHFVTRWRVWLALALLWAVADSLLWLNVGSDAGQAMPISGLAWFAFSVVGIAGLALLALVFWLI